MTQRRQIRGQRDYRSYLDQHAEWLERVGYAPDPDDRVEGFEQDLQDDLAMERAGFCLPLSLPPATRVVALPVTNNDDGSAAGTGRAA